MPVILTQSHSGGDAATKNSNCRMAEYARAVVDGRPNSIFLWWWMFRTVTATGRMIHYPAQYRYVRLLLILWRWIRPVWMPAWKQTPLPNSQLTDAMAKRAFVITMIILKIPLQMRSTRPVWSMRRRSVSAAGRMNLLLATRSNFRKDELMRPMVKHHCSGIQCGAIFTTLCRQHFESGIHGF